jgi:hypothetical protein
MIAFRRETRNAVLVNSRMLTRIVARGCRQVSASRPLAGLRTRDAMARGWTERKCTLRFSRVEKMAYMPEIRKYMRE